MFVATEVRRLKMIESAKTSSSRRILNFKSNDGKRFIDDGQKIIQMEKKVMPQKCKHFREVKTVEPSTPGGCEDCLKTGDSWVHLRLCQMCGHVDCCDSSKNKHATAHFHRTNHAIVTSFEPNENWGWCYVDELFFEPFPLN